METLSRLVKVRLHRLVLHVKLVDDRLSLTVSVVGELLPLLHEVYLVGERGEHACRPRAVKPHVLEHLGEYLEVALFLQRLQEREYRTVGVLLEHLGELANLDACNAGELLGVGGHLREQL